MNIKVTVITVCYNSENYIEETIKSVLGQTYENIEYLIIDGKSTDSTMDIINKFSKDSRVKVISEKDKGIYDAMNKGIVLSTGQYLSFMNSGDKFVNKDVIANIMNNINIDKDDLIYGNVLEERLGKVVGKINYGNIKVNSWYFIRGNMICHQAMFIKGDLLKQYPYNLNYSICADKCFLITCEKMKKRFKYIDYDICYYDKSGISSINIEEMKKQTKKIILNAYPFLGRCKYFASKLKQSIFTYVKR